jgi:hypothetical protein
LLTALLRITPGEAKARLAQARDLGPRRALTGEPLEPILPATADAVREGAISTGHVTVIAKTLDALPPTLSYEVSGYAETFLIQAARHEHPGQLRTSAALLLARLDPDGLEPREEELERRREFGLRANTDGSATPTGRFTPELTALCRTILDSLAAPQASPDGEPDTRHAGQRRHDALTETLTRVLRSGTLPDSGGVPVTILARTTLSELTTATGAATTSHGDTVSLTTLLQHAADAQIIPIICTDTGGILAYGRQRRLATKGQRLALAARDGGCTFPGCDRPAAWTEVHHIIAWLDGGTTDLDNMCLLCRYHHRHFDTLGWHVFMKDGTPWWRPPAWHDPERKPIRNTAHHLDDIHFQHAG